MDLWLTEQELKVLTKKSHRELQIRALNEMKPRPKFWVRKEDNFPLVDRWQFLGVDDKKKAG